MCALLLAWLCLVLGFQTLKIQSRPLTLQSLPHRHSHITQGDRHVIWRPWLHKEPPPSLSGPLLDQSDSELREPLAWQRGSRGRRHVSSRGHGHLMRVGCVLGTCQVQNLSHRLYQLIGQSGREDSSPINPRSPHSYG